MFPVESGPHPGSATEKEGIFFPVWKVAFSPPSASSGPRPKAPTALEGKPPCSPPGSLVLAWLDSLVTVGWERGKCPDWTLGHSVYGHSAGLSTCCEYMGLLGHKDWW